MKYDVAFIDLDGTLLRDDKSIPESNIKAIREMYKMGMEIVIASGRSHMSLKNVCDDLYLNNYDGYGIGFNGGTIFTRKPYNVIYESKIESGLAKIILSFIRNHNVETFVYAEEMLWIEKVTDRAVAYSRHSMIVPKKVKKLEQAVNYDVNKIIIMGNNDELKKIQAEFNKTELKKKIDCCFSSSRLLEFNNIKDNKGTAVKTIMNYDKFKNKKSIAIGDSYNDIPMFEVCDLSVVPSNSDEEVKARSSAVTNSNNNDGILSEIIEKFIL